MPWRLFLSVSLMCTVIGCSDAGGEGDICLADREKKTQEWCEEMMLVPNGEWQEGDFQAFSCDCI